MQPGDTVLIADGEYLGFTAYGITATEAAPVVLRAAGSGAHVVPTTDRGDNRDTIVISYCANVVLDGLRTANANRQGIRLDHGTRVTVRNCVIGNSGMSGIFTNNSDDSLIENNEVYGSRASHGVYLAESGDRPVFRGNRVHHNYAAGVQLNSDFEEGADGLITGAVIENNVFASNGVGGGAAIALRSVRDSVVRNNLLFDNHGTGILNIPGDSGFGPSGMVVVNNTVDMAADGKWALEFFQTAGPNLVRNNILLNRHSWRGGLRFYSSADAANTSSDYNVLQWISTDDGTTRISLASWQAQGQDRHSLSALPAALFINPVAAAADYHLRPGSPAIDRGETHEQALTDIEGQRRPAGASADIGCDEAAGAVSPPPSVSVALSSLAVTPGTVTGGTAAQGTVTLSAAAGTDGVSVALSAQGAGAAVPGAVLVAAGKTSAVFTISTTVVGTDSSVRVTAAHAGVTRSATLLVKAPAAPPPVTPSPGPVSIASVTFNPAAVVGGSPSLATVTLAAPAPAGGATLSLRTSNSLAAVPVAVTVPAGQTRVTFQVTTRVVTWNRYVNLTATSGSSSRMGRLYLNPR